MKIKEVDKICKIDGCVKSVFAKGFCRSHYRRDSLYGDANVVKQKQLHNMTVNQRFDFYVIKRQGCWGWSGFKDKNGYSRISVNNRQVLAHRLSWKLKHGSIPENMCVLHKCDNPECTNPKHLFLGSQLENIEDMHNKVRARQGHTYGTQHHRAKVNEEIVRHIRKEGNCSKEFAESIGLSVSSIHSILKFKTWKNVI